MTMEVVKVLRLKVFILTNIRSWNNTFKKVYVNGLFQTNDGVM